TGIPHFESKYKVEQHIKNCGIPYTIIGPTSFMENLLSYLSSYQNILEKIYRELEEYLIFIPDWYQREVIVAVFFSANISTVNLILRRLESYDGVKKVGSFIRSSVT